MRTYVEISKARCTECGRDVAVCRAEDRKARESVVVMSRHLARTRGFCDGSLSPRELGPRR